MKRHEEMNELLKAEGLAHLVLPVRKEVDHAEVDVDID